MKTSRLSLPFAAVILMFGPACASSTGSTTTTSGGGNGTGNANGSGATGATGGSASGASAGSPSGSAGVNGSSTGAKPPQDPIGAVCSKKGNSDYVPCSTSLDCQCKLYCAIDPVMGRVDAGGSICSLECMKTSDCPDIFTSCQNGLCTTNICEADGGGGAFMGPCDAEGTGDGTCEPVFSKTTQEIIGACFQAGTVSLDGGNCDPNQAPFTLASAGNTKRPNPLNLCPIGYQCVATGPTTGTCTQLCDPVFDGLSDNDAGGCLGGAECIAIGNDTLYGGHCIFQGDGGCEVGVGGGELAECTLDSDCECPTQCKIDFNSLAHLCEKTCDATLPAPDLDGGCDDPATSCQRGYCNYNYCVETYLGFPIGDAGNYGGPCNYATDAGDGLCVPGLAFQPFMNQMGTPTNPYGSCEPAGTAKLNDTCGNPPFCGPGLGCFNNGVSNNCYQLCNPGSDAGSGCTGTNGCFTLLPLPLQQSVGYCAPCAVAGDMCIDSSTCCDGFCAFAQPDAGSGSCN